MSIDWTRAGAASAALLLPLLGDGCSAPDTDHLTHDQGSLKSLDDTRAAHLAASLSVPLAYPDTARVDQVDDYHGTKVADPYRWLESTDSPETIAWVKAQNAVTESWLASIPARAGIHDRLSTLFNYERRGIVARTGGALFFQRNTGLQKQAVYFMEPDAGGGTPTAVIDPNSLSADGTIAVSSFVPSHDARFVAYATSDGGSDWKTWRVRDLKTLQDTADELRWSKFAEASWKLDGSGFYYCTFPAPQKGDELEAANKNQKVWLHQLGQKQEQDALVYERPDEPDWGFQPIVTDDGRFLVLNISLGTDRRNRVYCMDLSKAVGGGALIKLLDDFDASYDFVGSDGSALYFKTDLDAPKGRVIAIDVAKPARADWKEIVATSGDQLNGVSLVNHQLVLNYLHDASTQVKLVGLDGKAGRMLALPGIGTAAGFGGEIGDTATYYTFTSFTVPPTTYRYDFATGASTPWFAPKLDFDFSPYETRVVFSTSKDGTRVPMHVTCRKDAKLDGSNPCLLYGYGGFNIAMLPAFRTHLLVWLERGGIYAQAVLRGGSEFGEKWHANGMLSNKQNVFDDFIGCAEHLIASGYTRKEKLAIHGGSNGGLLVGACMTQRPDLFAAAVPAVGVLDMLRFHLFTIGKAWTTEYGCADDPAQFPWLIKYSPLQNLKAGTKYPATLVLTGDHDDRVVPGHSFKFAAALQAAQAGTAPTLIRIETRAGHGAGKSTQTVIDEQTDVFSFLTRALGMQGG